MRNYVILSVQMVAEQRNKFVA